jgi:NifU-like protein involved in Fe-S cluster formation
MAAGSMAARVLTGLTIEKALLLTAEDLLRILGGLPEGKEECAHRAIAAVRDALIVSRKS